MYSILSSGENKLFKKARKIKIMPIDKVLGMLAGPIIGGAMGQFQDNSSEARNERAAAKQFERQKELMDKSQNQQYGMWKATSYGAQMAEMKAAGLNPALMYGMGGGGGQTAGSSSGSASMAAPVNPKMADSAFMGIQLGLMNAQKENIEADTRNKLAGADNSQAQADITKGPILQKTLAEASNTAQDTALKQVQEIKLKAETELVNVEREIASIDKYVKGETRLDAIKQIKAEAIYAVLNNALTKATTGLTQAKAGLTKAETAATNKSVEVMDSQRRLNDQKVKESVNDIMRNWDSLSNDNQRLMLQSAMQAWETDGSREIKDDILGVLQQAVDGVMKGGKSPKAWNFKEKSWK